MKKIVCLLLALVMLGTALCACSKDETKSLRMDALLDYYENRMGIEMPEDCIDYVGKNDENGYYEYHIDNEEAEVKATLFVEVFGNVYTIYNAEGNRLHIYNGNNSAE